MRDKLMTFGFAALAAVATAGWMRQPVQIEAASLSSNFAPLTEAQPLPVMGAAGTLTMAPAVESAQASVYQTVAHNQPRLRTRSQRVTRDSGYRDTDSRYRDDDYRYDDGQRSTGKSAAIIAGSAGTGAAIGAMAGGGKGAAIGAIVGGVAGTIYDRKTHNKTDGWGWKRGQ